MKKLSILLLSVFYIGITNINAQSDATTEAVNTTEVVTATEDTTKKCAFTKNDKGELICVKTGKVCDSTCPKKASKTCCKGKASKKGSFNFNKSNNYSGKSSCSKSNSKKCCKKKVKTCGDDCEKACCSNKMKKCGDGCEKECCSKKESE